MNKKAQAQIIFNPRIIISTLGGGFLGYIIFHTPESAIIGGILGLIAGIFIR